MNYKVQLMMDQTYEVFEVYEDAEWDEYSSVFQGSLADCEAYIRLKKEGYIS